MSSTSTIEDASIVPTDGGDGSLGQFPALNEQWRTPSGSGNNGQCVSVRFVEGHVEVRNSNNPDGPVLRFTRTEWELFTPVADEEFRLPTA